MAPAPRLNTRSSDEHIHVPHLIDTDIANAVRDMFAAASWTNTAVGRSSMPFVGWGSRATGRSRCSIGYGNSVTTCRPMTRHTLRSRRRCGAHFSVTERLDRSSAWAALLGDGAVRITDVLASDAHGTEVAKANFSALREILLVNHADCGFDTNGCVILYMAAADFSFMCEQPKCVRGPWPRKMSHRRKVWAPTGSRP